MAFPARHDHWILEPGDAVAAQIGGALIDLQAAR